MTIIEAILSIKQLSNGNPFDIPDCSRDKLPQFFVDMGYKVGAEIGVHKGEFTKKLCNAGLTVYAIDPWIGFPGQGRYQKLQVVQDAYYEEAKQVLAFYPNCTIIRKTSMDAVDDFKSDSLDFVYIDGNHNFRHVAEDIFEWSKKVRKGGAISGHDYFNTQPYANNVICHVGAVVDAYVKLFEIKDWYVFGSDKRDRSWLWIKP